MKYFKKIGSITGGWDKTSLIYFVPEDVNAYVTSLQNKVPNELLDREDNIPSEPPHITLLFNIEYDNEEDLKNISKEYKNIKLVTDNKITYFDNDKQSVAKIEVKDPTKMLEKLHKEYKNNFKNGDSFPEYNAHMTIAYLKPGERLPFDKIKIFEINMDRFSLSYPEAGKLGLIKLGEES